MNNKLSKLRNIINENLRTQLKNNDVEYVSSGHTLDDVIAKQSHCIFARRGCGKTLLLHHSRRRLPHDVKAIYINCEDFKHHSFPNVLIEILDAIFRELEKNLGGWFGKSKKLKAILSELRESLVALRSAPDERDVDIRESVSVEDQKQTKANATLAAKGDVGSASAQIGTEKLFKNKSDIEKKYQNNENKLLTLNHNLPSYKEKIKEFFFISTKVSSVFVQLDDFYQLNKADQPFVADYIHRLCKDTSLKFKIATLKHNSVLYIERGGQPIGIQERHDYQPINIDFNFEQFDRTRKQNRGIFIEYAKLAGMTPDEFDSLFKGTGFDRLILAGGGVPRDSLSFFLEVLDRVKSEDPSGKIGKDEVRFLSRETFDRRIEELKQDSEGQDQDALMRGIYAIRQFCLDKKSSVFLVAENDIQRDDDFKVLLYRLLDYRIIHRVANSLTHKSKTGPNYQGFSIDIGCYAYMRNLHGRLNEIDLTEVTAKEKMRSAPVLESETFKNIWKNAAGKSAELALVDQEN